MEMTPEMQAEIAKQVQEQTETAIKTTREEFETRIKTIEDKHAAEVSGYKETIKQLINGKNEPTTTKMDELIEEKKALLSDWQQFKKGLLQQMFV